MYLHADVSQLRTEPVNLSFDSLHDLRPVDVVLIPCRHMDLPSPNHDLLNYIRQPISGRDTRGSIGVKQPAIVGAVVGEVVIARFMCKDIVGVRVSRSSSKGGQYGRHVGITAL